MVTDITIWTAPTPAARYESKGTDAARADVTGHSAGDEFTDADFVPVSTYPKPLGAVTRMDHAVAVSAQAAIQLYTSIFNYRYPPAGGLSVHV